MVTSRLARTLLIAYVVIFLLYLLAPMFVVVVLAFNDSPVPSLPFKGLTLRWFNQLFHNVEILTSLKNSILIASVVTGLSVGIGLVTSFALVRHGFLGKDIFYTIMFGPIITPGIILGVSLLLFSYRIGLEPGYITVIGGHLSFCAAFATIIISARLRQLSLEQEEAAMDLGANRLQAIWKVTIPHLRPALLSAAAISFLMSFDNFNTSVLLVGSKRTLPVQIYSMLRFGLDPTVNAVAVVLIGTALLIGILSRIFDVSIIKR